MRASPAHRPFPLLRAALACTLLGALTATPARAERIALSDMMRGTAVTQAQCAARPSTVWVTAMGREFCIRYYLSTAGGKGPKPVVVLQGDRLGRLDGKTGEFNPGPTEKDVDTDDLVKYADFLSKQSGTTAIYFARVGIDGSSGNHRIRRTVLELQATNAALDAIKQRHKFTGYNLVGQSGGSTLAGGMLVLRNDIGCAVLGSGMLAFPRPARPSQDPALAYFNVVEAVSEIAKKRATRIFVVTDPEDKVVPGPSQTNFVNALRQAGGEVEQLTVQAIDDNRHGVVRYAQFAMSGCVRNASTALITKRVQELVEKTVEMAAANGTRAAETPTAGRPQPRTTSAPTPFTLSEIIAAVGPSRGEVGGAPTLEATPPLASEQRTQ